MSLRQRFRSLTRVQTHFMGSDLPGFEPHGIRTGGGNRANPPPREIMEKTGEASSRAAPPRRWGRIEVSSLSLRSAPDHRADDIWPLRPFDTHPYVSGPASDGRWGLAAHPGGLAQEPLGGP